MVGILKKLFQTHVEDIKILNNTYVCKLNYLFIILLQILIITYVYNIHYKNIKYICVKPQIFRVKQNTNNMYSILPTNCIIAINSHTFQHLLLFSLTLSFYCINIKYYSILVTRNHAPGSDNSKSYILTIISIVCMYSLFDAFKFSFSLMYCLFYYFFLVFKIIL